MTEWISATLAAIPEWAAGVGLFILATAVALLLYTAAAKLVMALTADHAQFARALFLRARKLLFLALILLVVNFTAQLPYFPERISRIAANLLSAAVVILVGWTAIIAIDLAASYYLRRQVFGDGNDLLARKHQTQIRVLKRAVDVLIVIITVAATLMAFEPVRQFGVSLFASAGAAGLIVGLAARPVLSNLIAGIQLGITQPIRINDAVVIEGEWGWIEEITSTYVVVKIWDRRRLIVPLSYFMEKPFQNWTRDTAQIIGTVFLRTDYMVPVEQMRKKLEEIVQASPLWDKDVVNLQVTDITDEAVELRILVSAATSPQAWDLRCDVREKLLTYLQTEFPDKMPRRRVVQIPYRDTNEAGTLLRDTQAAAAQSSTSNPA
jgi:small-conductance mechanosensitive channel